MCCEDAFWRVGFVLMASMLAGLYTVGGVYKGRLYCPAGV